MAGTAERAGEELCLGTFTHPEFTRLDELTATSAVAPPLTDQRKLCEMDPKCLSCCILHITDQPKQFGVSGAEPTLL